MAMSSGTDLSTINNTSVQKTRYLLHLLLHAHKCLQRERQTTNNTNDNHETTSQNLCTAPHCATMRGVLQHMTKCSDSKNCSFNNCVQSRHIILHWKNCTTPNCYVCGPSKNTNAFRSENPSTKEWQQQILTTTLSSIDKSAGEQGPSNAAAPELDDNSKSNSTITLLSDDESFDEQDPPKGTTPQSVDKYTSNPTTTLSEHGDKDPKVPIDINRLAIRINDPNAHADTSGNHANAAGVNMKETALSLNTKNPARTIDEKMSSTVTTTEIEPNKTNRPPAIDATSKSSPKHPAVFSPDDIRKQMTPILDEMNDQEEGSWFRQPVTEDDVPGYSDTIKYPMDFSTIYKKLHENQYTTPCQFCEDVWLVFNNAWTFNKKTAEVYKNTDKLSDKFVELVDPVMKDYGYCCGCQYLFLPSTMFCYGVACMSYTIPRAGDYFVYNNPDSSRNNLSSDKYTICKTCFKSVKSKDILVGDDPEKVLVKLSKCKFDQAKNDHQEHEPMVDCIVCSRRFHNICVLYHEHIWPEGYVCKTCINPDNIEQKENNYLAHQLRKTKLSDALEKRVNTFLRKEYERGTGRVTIRVLAASDRVCEVKPRFKKHVGLQAQDGYPYREKAIFAFQEIKGVDVVLFGMYVQEYDSQCPEPNARRVYISYLDSVHYFQPKQKRTELYQEILIGYLEYVKQLGFLYAHIWACPPNEGVDYIFHCHPLEQRVPNRKRLQDWYKKILDTAILQRVIFDYKDIIKYCTDSGVNKVTNIPYLEGDFWTSAIEDIFEKPETAAAYDNIYSDGSLEAEEQTESSKKRKLCVDTTNKKKNRSDLSSKMNSMVKERGEQKESFFVIRLHNPMSDPTTLTDTDPLIQCDLMESRDAFLSFARDKHCEFSSLRRAKYSTMVSLIKLHSSTADKSSYECNACRQQCDVRYHCTVCEDYDLCTKCYTTIKHEHAMERFKEANETTTEHEHAMECSVEPNETTTEHADRMECSVESNEITTNSNTPVNIEQQTPSAMQKIDTIRHAVQCQDANCTFNNCPSCKRLIKHTNGCRQALEYRCSLCNKLLSLIWLHSKTCPDQNCSLPHCAHLKHIIQRSRAATTQTDRRRVEVMDHTKMGPDPAPLNSQNSEPTATAQYHHSMKSSSLSSLGDKGNPGCVNSGYSTTTAHHQQQVSHPPLTRNVTAGINNNTLGIQSALSLPLTASLEVKKE